MDNTVLANFEKYNLLHSPVYFSCLRILWSDFFIEKQAQQTTIFTEAPKFC